MGVWEREAMQEQIHRAFYYTGNVLFLMVGHQDINVHFIIIL